MVSNAAAVPTPFVSPLPTASGTQPVMVAPLPVSVDTIQRTSSQTSLPPNNATFAHKPALPGAFVHSGQSSQVAERCTLCGVGCCGILFSAVPTCGLSLLLLPFLPLVCCLPHDTVNELFGHDSNRYYAANLYTALKQRR